MTLDQIFFLLAAGATLGAAVMVVSSPRVMHAALWLILALAGIAVLFALLDAGFFAVIQVLIYIGAIAVLIVFAVMLTRRVMEDQGAQHTRGWPLALVACLALFAGLVFAVSSWPVPWQTAPLSGAGLDVTQLGLQLADPGGFVIPFEVASVLLLAALIGAVYVGRERKNKP